VALLRRAQADCRGHVPDGVLDGFGDLPSLHLCIVCSTCMHDVPGAAPASCELRCAHQREEGWCCVWESASLGDLLLFID
jgi:hypothetical protein